MAEVAVKIVEEKQTSPEALARSLPRNRRWVVGKLCLLCSWKKLWSSRYIFNIDVLFVENEYLYREFDLKSQSLGWHYYVNVQKSESTNFLGCASAAQPHKPVILVFLLSFI